jgi:LysM repeat protein
MHRVRRGETLSIIALRYRTSIQKIVEANNMRSGKLLRVGQRLKIPVRNST